MAKSRPIEGYWLRHGEFLVIVVVDNVLLESLNYTISGEKHFPYSVASHAELSVKGTTLLY